MMNVVNALIIEDTPDHAELIRMSLNNISGCRTVIAENMQLAKSFLCEQNFDVIITDLNLPDSNRHQTVGTLKEIAPLTPLLVLTCDSVNIDGNDSISLGAQEYLRKDELPTTRIDRLVWHAIERQRILNENMALAEELHSRNMALEIANEKAESGIQAKTEFLTNMSHEIRTPITSILGYLDIALDTTSVLNDSFALEALSSVKRNSNHLLALINDILDVAKVEAGAMTIELIPCEITDILQSSIELVTPQLSVKDLVISQSIAADVPNQLLLDPTRLTQIIVNLLGNAIKFTQDGSVSIHVSSTPADQDTHWISVEIKDTGIGIRQDELVKIQEFNAFVQADIGTTRKYGGTGLGLRISHALAQIMGGSIEIESEYEIGSCLTLNIKAQAVDVSSELRVSSQSSLHTHVPDLTGLRVLITDDSSDNCKLFEYYLSKLNVTVESVHHGGECVSRILDSSMPSLDFVLMDLQMPTMDGITAYKTLRKAGATLPIYATSASTTNEDKENVIKAGFTGFIAKPIDPERLLEVAQYVFNKRTGRSNVA